MFHAAPYHILMTGAIVILSLGSDLVMELRKGDDHRPVLLSRRSLLILAGESRYAWLHYIPHRKSDWLGPGSTNTVCSTDGTGGTAGREQQGLGAGGILQRGRRVSLTMRQVRGRPCDCVWPECCDSRAGGAPPTRLAQLREQGQGQGDHAQAQGEVAGSQVQTQGPVLLQECDSAVSALLPGAPSKASTETPQPPSSATTSHSQPEAELVALEARHVNAVYDAIAPHFSATRFAIWPAVRAFMGRLPPGAVVADVGCGNGKYFGVRRDVAVLGSDRSAGGCLTAVRVSDCMRACMPGLVCAHFPACLLGVRQMQGRCMCTCLRVPVPWNSVASIAIAS